MNYNKVTLKAAKALKKIGYNRPCSHAWTLVRMTGEYELVFWGYGENVNLKSEIDFSAPSVHEASRWLREKLGADIVVSPRFDSETGERIGYFWRWCQRTDVNDSKIYKTFEKALRMGIEKVLEPFMEGGES